MSQTLITAAIVLAALVGVFFAGRAVGKAGVEKNEAQDDAEAAKRISEAHARSPVTSDELGERLRDPDRGL